MTTATVTQPWELWNKVCEEAGLELSVNSRPGRDADIEDALRNALGTPASAASLQEWLKKDADQAQPEVSTERLLVELLKSQAGFALMMTDILGTLANAEARNAAHSMRISFKFEGMSEPLVNTLKEFRESVTQLKRSLATRYVVPDAATLWQLWGIFNSLAPGAREEFPDQFPAIPTLGSTGDSSLDSEFQLIADLILDVHNLWRCHGVDCGDVMRARNALKGQSPDDERLRDQLSMASDFWSHKLLASMAKLRELISSGRLDALTVNQKLSPFLRSLPSKQHWVRETVQAFIDVLKLPTFKRRHELYSVWVGTRLLEATRAATPTFRFETVDNMLSFSFGGSLLATYTDQSERYEIWAELRSQLLAPSNKRKGEIQPDFRVVKTGLADAGQRTVYVLECKHYLRANRSNFTTAVKDYAESCPDAHVHLVNHGPADDTALRAALPSQLQLRARFIGNATAGSDVGMKKLPEAIQTVLFPGRVAAAAPPTAGAARPNQTRSLTKGLAAQVFLNWDTSLQDMDLALHILDANDNVSEKVNFQFLGDINKRPFAQLTGDVRTGPGEECIEIAKWSFAKYALVATNFSAQGSMNPHVLSCTIVTTQDTLTLKCPIQLPPTQLTWQIAQIEVKERQLLVTTSPDHPQGQTALAL